MRAVYSKTTMALLVATVGLFTSVFTASAQLTTVVPAVGATWKYIETDVSSQNWTNRTYDDTAWLSGPSGFSYETGANDVTHVQGGFTLVRTALTNPANDPAGSARHAEYFRTKFTWSGATAGVFLVLHTRWDDSGVVYLNGVPVANNTGATLPLGFIQYTRGAIGPGTEGTVDEPFTVDVTGILVAGENVLAAELHQVNAGSSDRVFVCEANIGIAAPPAITNAALPADRVVLQNRSVTNVVQAIGFPLPTYQWYFQPTGGGGFNPVPNGTNATLIITSMQSTDEGDYYCVVSNSAGSVTSRTAHLTFSTDTVPPIALRAIGSATHATVVVEFNEALEALSAQDAFNYEVFDASSIPLGVTASTLNPGGTSVTLDLAALMVDDAVYTASVNSVKDAAGNDMVPASLPFRC